MNMYRSLLCVIIISLVILLVHGVGVAQGLHGIINTDGVNLRSGPSTSSEVITVLSAGEPVGYFDVITDADGNKWTNVYVSSTRQRGYALACYISLDPRY